MTLSDLANKEIDLYSNVIVIYEHKKSVDKSNLSLNQIHTEYKNVHEKYAEKSDNDIEALKRGLFIQWYAQTEPNYLTGINELDEKAERKIITDLKKRIDENKTDAELIKMLNYYLTWDYVFDRFKDIAVFQKSNVDKILQIKTDARGQMGIYWKSITAE